MWQYSLCNPNQFKNTYLRLENQFKTVSLFQKFIDLVLLSYFLTDFYQESHLMDI